MQHTLYINVDQFISNDVMSRFLGYKPEHPMVIGGQGDLPECETLELNAELAFNYYNHPSRPNGDTHPSMSIGDVIVFHTPDGDVGYALNNDGWVQVPVPLNVITERSWVEIAAHAAA